MNEQKSGFDSGAPKKPTEWKKGEVEGKNSKVKFEQVRPRNPDGKVARGPLRNRATVTFSQKLLKAKLGEERFKKLMKARKEGPAPARFVPPKVNIGTYQHKGEDQGYLACPIPTTGISSGADEILDTVQEELIEEYGIMGPTAAFEEGFTQRERLHLGKDVLPNEAAGVSETKLSQFAQAARLSYDLTTETIWKDRGSDFNGMAEQVQSWRYFMSMWGLMYVLTRGVDRVQRFFRGLLWKATGCSTLTGPFSVVDRLKSWWDNKPGLFYARAQRFGWRLMIRHWLVKSGRLNPALREVKWSGQKFISQNGAEGFLATSFDPEHSQGMTEVIARAQELGVDHKQAVRIWAQYAFNRALYDWSLKTVWEKEGSKLKGVTFEQVREDWISWHTKEVREGEPLNERALRIFVVTLLADKDLPTKPEAPKPEHVIDLHKATRDLWNSCVKCRGTNKHWDHTESRYVECTHATTDKQAVVELKNGVTFVRCPNCNAFDANILPRDVGVHLCTECGISYHYNGRTS